MLLLSQAAMKGRSAALGACLSARSASALSCASPSPSLLSSIRDPTLLGGALPSDSDAFPVTDPGAPPSGPAVALVARMGRDDAADAIGRASAALPGWRDGTTAAARSSILSRWSGLIGENREDVAAIMTLESGKPLSESLGEVAYGRSFLDYYAAEAVRPTSAGGGFVSPSPFVGGDGSSARGRIMAVHEAVGVCALITPWNFPIAMITRKVGPALAAGAFDLFFVPCACVFAILKFENTVPPVRNTQDARPWSSPASSRL